MRYEAFKSLTPKREEGLRFNPKMDKFVIGASPLKWFISREDGTTAMVAGLYFLNPMAPPYIWFIPHESFGLRDVRGLGRLFDLLKPHHKVFMAVVDEEHSAAVRAATHYGFVRQAEGIFKWQTWA